jgi:chromosomal replication initiator protein
MENSIKVKIDESQTVWNECLKVIRDNIEHSTFHTWFAPIKPVQLSGQVLTIQVPSLYYYEFLEGNHWRLLKAAIKKILGAEGMLEYKIPVAANTSITLPPSGVGCVKNPEKSLPILGSEHEMRREMPDPFLVPGIKKIVVDSQLKPDLNFDTFIEGECNRMARSTGYSIAQNLAKGNFNPMFVYSNVGLGKTHLLHAIGLETKVRHPELTVLYIDAEKFTQQYVEAAKGGNITDFVHYYQMLEMLLIDDIQFLSGKPRTQETFFHIFNHLHQQGKIIIITADKSPAEISGFEQRLLSRFKWGVQTELEPPDRETRIRIINSKLYYNGISSIPDEVVEYLACRVVTNIRELEGAIISILAQASCCKKEITVDLAKQMIDKFVRSASHEISIEFIQKVVCDYFQISYNVLFTSSRKRDVVQVRQLSMYFSRKYTDKSLAQIGAACGGKDHATVLHACQAVENLKQTNRQFKQHVDTLDKIFKNS